jgi:Type I phosphodiesterase / nucleotide pyrophosphatase
MGEVARLLAAFATGDLVRPDAARANFLDLVGGLYRAAGASDVPGLPAGDHARAIERRLAGAEHIVFVLADGLGTHFVDTLPADAWLRAHLDRPLQAPFPPTTAVSLTSIATGRWVTEHAATGWWTYVPARDLVCVPLPYQRLSDEHPLDDLGIAVEEVFPAPPIMARMRFAPELVLPRAIADSVYSRYLGGGSPRTGYESLRDAVARIVERVESARGATFTYWYTPRIDTLAHDLGTRDERTLAAVRELDEALAALAERLDALAASTRLVVSADHGHRDVVDGGHRTLAADDPLMTWLRCHPTGDVRAVYFHLRLDATASDHAAFRAAFADRFGDRWVLLATDELEALRLMGPSALSPETRRRVGDYTAIALGAEVLRYAGVPGTERFMRQRSQHGGLSPDEMTVPLVIA